MPEYSPMHDPRYPLLATLFAELVALLQQYDPQAGTVEAPVPYEPLDRAVRRLHTDEEGAGHGC
jgi:hypothetical protein